MRILILHNLKSIETMKYFHMHSYRKVPKCLSLKFGILLLLTSPSLTPTQQAGGPVLTEEL